MGGQQPGPPAGTSSRGVGEALASGAPQHASGVKAGLRRSEAPAAPAHPCPLRKLTGPSPAESVISRDAAAEPD